MAISDNQSIEHIKQEADYDCTVAVLAMVMGYAYEEMIQMFPYSPDDKFGVTMDEVTYIALRCGGLLTRLATVEGYNAFFPGLQQERQQEAYLITHNQAIEIIKKVGVRAILEVEGFGLHGPHAVAYCPLRQKVLDPKHDDMATLEQTPTIIGVNFLNVQPHVLLNIVKKVLWVPH